MTALGDLLIRVYDQREFAALLARDPGLEARVLRTAINYLAA